MLPSYFDYNVVPLRQKLRLRPELSPKFLSPLGPNSTQKARLDLQLCSWQCIIGQNLSRLFTNALLVPARFHAGLICT